MKSRGLIALSILILRLSSLALAEKTQPQDQKKARQGQSCSQMECEQGLECLKFYGIAGPSGPPFSSCEIPCQDSTDKCPGGQSCITIFDGPGPVCRPPRSKEPMFRKR